MMVVMIVIIFALFNQDDMVLNIVNMYEVILPKFFVVICAFLIGFIVAIMVFSVKVFSLKLKLRKLAIKYKAAQIRLNNAGLSEIGIKQKILKLFRFNDR